jgi:hypothetical protein
MAGLNCQSSMFKIKDLAFKRLNDRDVRSNAETICSTSLLQKKKLRPSKMRTKVLPWPMLHSATMPLTLTAALLSYLH